MDLCTSVSCLIVEEVQVKVQKVGEKIQSSRDLEFSLIFRNHLILKKVLAYLSIDDLKNCRAVNTECKSVFNSAFMEKSRVKFNNCDDMIAYVTTTAPNQAHVNYKLMVCDLPQFKESVEIFGIFLSKYSGLKDVIIDLDVSKPATCELIATTWEKLIPQKSVENLRFHQTNSILEDKVDLSLIARELMTLFPNVAFLQFYSIDVLESFSDIFLEEILKTPDAFNNLTSIQFDLDDQYQYNVSSVQLLVQLPFTLKNLDLGFMFPEFEVTQALEKCLAKHSENLESFKVGVGNSKEQFGISFPTIKRLELLDVFHKKASHNIDIDYVLGEKKGLYFTRLHVIFNFGGSTFIQKLPALQKLRLRNEYIGTNSNDIIVRRPSTELLDSFFGQWPENEVCDKKIKIEIANVWANSMFFMKVRKDFPNAKIIKTKL